jgi:CheY-like chemotaxis protein
MSAVTERVQLNCSLPDDLPAVSGNGGQSAQALLHVLLAFSDRAAVLEITAHTSPRGVHLTITEKGDSDSREPSNDSIVHWRTAQTLLLRSGAEIHMEPDHCELVFQTIDAQNSAPNSRPESSGAAKRVLIIDDEEGIARILETSLRDRFAPTIASSGEEALRLISEGAFDAIVCDVNLPDMNGVELFQKIARIRPEQLPHLIFITGGVIDESINTFIERAQVPCLEKPFRISEVIRAVQSRL